MYRMNGTSARLAARTCAVSLVHRQLSTIQIDSPLHQLAQQPFSLNDASSSSSSSTSSTSLSLSSPGITTPSHSSRSALALLRSQPSYYIVASLYMRRYLLTPRDLLTVPRLKNVKVGDILELERIHELGSRDYLLQAKEGETLYGNLVHCKATVVEHTKGRMEETVKFKKRKGYKKTIKNKSMYTRLRIGDITLGDDSLDGK